MAYQPDDIIEKEQLILLRENDERAFTAIYDQYSLQIYRKLLYLVKIEDVASELTQDVFVKIWEKRHLIDPEQSFRSYLYKIAGNLVADFYRKLARDKQLKDAIIRISTSAAAQSVEKDFINAENKKAVHEAISQLPPQQQYVFQLCKIEGHSYEEAGQLLGISATTVKNHLVRANKTIKRYLMRYHYLLLLIICRINKF